MIIKIRWYFGCFIQLTIYLYTLKVVYIMNIGHTLRKIRELKGIKQETVASMLNMTAQGYGKIERNETDISLVKLDKIATVFDITVQDILSFDESKYFINTQNNTNNDKIIICGSYHEKETLNQTIKILTDRVDKLEKIISNLTTTST